MLCPCCRRSPGAALLSGHPAPCLLQKLRDPAVRKYLGWEARDCRTPLLGNQSLMILKKTNPNLKQNCSEMPAGFTETHETARVHPSPLGTNSTGRRIPPRLKVLGKKTEVTGQRTVATGFHTHLHSVCRVSERR